VKRPGRERPLDHRDGDTAVRRRPHPDVDQPGGGVD
jgi:hypothetical protein